MPAEGPLPDVVADELDGADHAAVMAAHPGGEFRVAYLTRADTEADRDQMVREIEGIIQELRRARDHLSAGGEYESGWAPR